MKHTIRFPTALTLLAVAAIAVTAARADQVTMVEDFDAAWRPGRWQFSNGQEFPGAKGQFARTADAAHGGQWGGKLTFDFTGGGNYVSARLPPGDVTDVAALRLWIKKPRGNRLKLRYADQTGQTLQKSFYAPDEQWAEVDVGFTGWESFWGGAKDGVPHGPPRSIEILIESDGQVRGSLLLDDVRLVQGKPGEVATMATGQYVAARFDPAEGWHIQAGGDAGETRLDGRTWRYDFTHGARWVAVLPEEFTLPGTPREIHLRVQGKAAGHSLRLQMGSHFTTFERTFYLSHDGENEVVVPAPPEKGWKVHGGEATAALHGPLRIKGLFLDAVGKADRGELELINVEVVAEYPPQRACIMVADLRSGKIGPEFVATIRSMLDKPVQAKINWTLRNWTGKIVDEGTQVLTIPASGEAAEAYVKMPEGHGPFLEAEFTADLPGARQIVSPAQAYYTAPIEPRALTEPDSASPFGMGVYLYRYPHDPSGLSDMDRAAKIAQDIGVKWSREEFNWETIEPKRGEYDWAFYNNVEDTAARHGISVYGLLAYWSPWTKPYTPEGIDDYCRFAADCVRRYRGKIRYWEVWNEPNTFFWKGPKGMYAELLEKAYAAIKEAEPEAVVLGCSTSQIDLKFIRRTMELDAPFDILTIHPYRGTLYDPGFVHQLQEVAEVVRPHNAGTIPGVPRSVWITEMGWPTHVAHNSIEAGMAPTTERHQAELLVRTYMDAIAAAGNGPAANVSWYDFRNGGNDPFNYEWNMGVVHRDLTPKPACRAYATMTQLLTGFHFDTTLDLGKGVIAYVFAKGESDRQVIVLWSLDQDRTVAVPTKKAMTLTNPMGEGRRVEPSGGMVRIDLRADVPLFLVGE